MTLKEIIAKLKEIEGTETLVSELEKQVEVLDNKGKAVEAKNEEIQNLKTQITTIEAKKVEIEEQLEEARTKGASQADGFKTLYEEKKVELAEAKKQIEELTNSKTQLETLKAKQEEKLKEEIELLYKELPEDKKEFVKNMAERYPLEERISFISDFTDKFGTGGNKKKGGKLPSTDIDQEMEDAQKLYDEILAIPMHRRTQKQRKDLITLGKILAGKISLK